MSRIVVVGGGLSGLSAAHRLIERRPDADVTVLEAASRPGGILGTVERDGFVIETGPDSILSDKTAALALAWRLGIADRIVRTRDAHRGAYVVADGRLQKVPEGFSLMAPTRWLPWFTTPIVSARGKLRAALEPLVPRRMDGEESMASFVRRRFGTEVFDRLAQPLVGGIYGGDPEQLSLEATMPRFIEMERTHGSVLRAMRAQRRPAVERAASGARYGLFIAFDRGMQVLIDALVSALGSRIRTGTMVSGLERVRDRWLVRAGDEALEADQVIIALPSWRAAALLEAHHGRLATALAAIPYGSAATVTFAWPRSAIAHPMDAFGFVVPSVEHRPVLAATFSSVKWPGRAPPGDVLLRVFAGGVHLPNAVALEDADLIALSRRELHALMGIEAPPRFAIVRRHDRAMPQYRLGHRARVDAIEMMQRELPGVHLVGNAYRGVGIPDTIRHAEGTAERALEG